MENTKITKKDILNAIKAVASQDAEAMFNDVVSAKDVIDFVDTTIAQLDAKAAKAKERAAKAKAEGDEIRDAIEAVLTDEFKPIATIIEEVGIEDLTPGKVSARVGQLIKLGRAEKADIKVGDKKMKGYALPGASEAAAEVDVTE